MNMVCALILGNQMKTEAKDAPASEIPGSRLEQLPTPEAAINAQLKSARTSILNSFIDLGMIERCDAVTQFMTDKKYQIPFALGRAEVNLEYTRWDRDTSRVNPDSLAKPLSLPGSFLIVGYGFRRGEITVGWTDGQWQRRVSMILGDDARTVLVRVSKRGTDELVHEEEESESFYRDGRIIKSEYVAKNVKNKSLSSDFSPTGFLARCASLEPSAVVFHKEIAKQETSITPTTLAEFQETEEWQVINALEKALRREAVDKLRGQTATGHTFILHVPRPSRKHNPHN